LHIYNKEDKLDGLHANMQIPKVVATNLKVG